MQKKLILVLFLFFLFGCTKNVRNKNLQQKIVSKNFTKICDFFDEHCRQKFTEFPVVQFLKDEKIVKIKFEKNCKTKLKINFIDNKIILLESGIAANCGQLFQIVELKFLENIKKEKLQILKHTQFEDSLQIQKIWPNK